MLDRAEIDFRTPGAEQLFKHGVQIRPEGDMGQDVTQNHGADQHFFARTTEQTVVLGVQEFHQQFGFRRVCSQDLVQ